jgi:hypothetical protein
MSAQTEKTGRGWIGFAGALLLISGAFLVIDGAAAVSGSSIYVNGAKFIFADLNTWGWILIVLGAFKVVVAAGVFARNEVAVSAAIIIVGLSIIGELLSAARYPLWSLVAVAIDVLIIYGLFNYGLTDD